MSQKKTAAEKRADLIIKYRNLKIEKRETEENVLRYFLSQKNKKIVLLCIFNQPTLGIAYVRELKQLVDKEGADKGILVGDGKYTYSARSNSVKLGIELIPPTLPTFDIFNHVLTPKAEIVSEKEKKKLIETYHAQPYQFPWIKASDPVSIILGAVPGDVIKITSKSETAGTSESYRYVV